MAELEFDKISFDELNNLTKSKLINLTKVEKQRKSSLTNIPSELTFNTIENLLDKMLRQLEAVFVTRVEELETDNKAIKLEIMLLKQKTEGLYSNLNRKNVKDQVDDIF